jgi:transposase
MNSRLYARVLNASTARRIKGKSRTKSHARLDSPGFVITLLWSRALYPEFFFDQTMENFLRGHVRASQDWSGAPRIILYDNLRSAVLERRGDQIYSNPRLLELAAHYHFVPAASEPSRLAPAGIGSQPSSRGAGAGCPSPQPGDLR